MSRQKKKQSKAPQEAPDAPLERVLIRYMDLQYDVLDGLFRLVEKGLGLEYERKLANDARKDKEPQETVE